MRARRPAYVVPFTVDPRTRCVNISSLDTTAAVRWAFIFSHASRTSGKSSSPYDVSTWKGPKISVVTSLKFSSLAMMVLRGTNTAVGSTAPYSAGTSCAPPLSSLPPNAILAPGNAASFAAWSSMVFVVTVSVGPTVKSSKFRLDARAAIFSSMPAATQLSCMKRIDCAEHFCPLHAYASWSHTCAT